MKPVVSKPSKRWNILVKKIQQGRVVKMVELGVWRGQMASRILPALPLLDWTGIDTWSPPAQGTSYAQSGAEIAGMEKKAFTDAYHMVVMMANTYGKRAHIIVGDTAESAKNFEDASLDVVFIDADHSYEGCKRDILAWKSKVRKGGLLCGHDYANKKGEVKKAVDECVGRVELGDDHTWWKII